MAFERIAEQRIRQAMKDGRSLASAQDDAARDSARNALADRRTELAVRLERARGTR
jgi:hypothetical protein